MKNYSNKFAKGFTLIELLVVIAIIGILSEIVLASLGTARTKGMDATVKAGMNQIRNQAAIYYDSNGNTYGPGVTGCSSGVFSSTQISDMIVNIQRQASSTPACYTSSDGSAWTMSITLKGGSDWCVDSTGASRESAAASTGLCN